MKNKLNIAYGKHNRTSYAAWIWKVWKLWNLTWSTGSVNSENALPNSRPQMKSSNLSVKPVDLM